MTLAAADLGLGSCWICAFEAELCNQLLQLPDNLEPIALLPLGYPLRDGRPVRKRKSMEELVSWEEYQ